MAARTSSASPSAGAVAAAAAVPGGYWILTELGVHIVRLTGAERTPIYQLIGEAAIGLLAFGITPAVILLTLTPGARLTALMKFHGDEVRLTIVRALWAVLALLVAVVIALALDQGDPGERWPRYIVLGAAASALSAVIRLVRQFSQLMKLINIDKTTPERSPLRPIVRDSAG